VGACSQPDPIGRQIRGKPARGRLSSKVCLSVGCRPRSVVIQGRRRSSGRTPPFAAWPSAPRQTSAPSAAGRRAEAPPPPPRPARTGRRRPGDTGPPGQPKQGHKTDDHRWMDRPWLQAPTPPRASWSIHPNVFGPTTRSNLFPDGAAACPT
jgi:hypothetical protein